MASNPPFQVEDTDEDFFDKLVDDEFDGAGPSSKTVDGSDSDEAKAFANLSIDDLGCEGGFEVEGEAADCGVKASSLDAQVEESSSLVSSASFSFSAVTEPNNSVMESGAVPESTESNTGGSGGSGVKEVQWSLFNTESVENESHGFGSYSEFFSELGETDVDFPGNVEEKMNSEIKTLPLDGETTSEELSNSIDYGQYNETQGYVTTVQQNDKEQDLNSSQDWENLYPGWKYDHNSGQWYQVDGYDMTTSNQGNFDSAAESVFSDGKSEVSYLQQTSHSVVKTVTESGTNTSVSNVTQGSQVNNGYPDHMVFDPQYPGWYYDTIALEWRALETYGASSDQTSVQAYDQHDQDKLASTGNSQNINSGLNNDYKQTDNYVSQGYVSQGQNNTWSGSFNNYNQQSDSYASQGYGSQGHDSSWSEPLNNYHQSSQNGFTPNGTFSHSVDSKVYNQYVKTDSNNLVSYGGQGQDSKWGGSSRNNSQQHLNKWQSETNAGSESNSYFDGTQQMENSYDNANQGRFDTNGTVLRGYAPGNFSQEKIVQNVQSNFPNDHYNSQTLADFSDQSIQGNHKSYHNPNMGRSSAGRPSHAIVTFGFGGKLIVMKDNSSLNNSSYGNQELVSGSVSILNLMEVVKEKADTPNIGVGACDYFRSLCQQSFPGPLVGGNVGSKELNKWIDERIATCDSTHMDYRNSELLRLLLSLLKISCQYYGKLRSPIGADILRVGDIPESAVAKLFASVKKNGAQISQYGKITDCLHNFPSESQIQVTASEVQNLLVSGRTQEALHCAQEGQLWGPALVLASKIGDQFYAETVKLMAIRQLVPGSPLRTLCLLIAGQPADVFSSDSSTDNGHPGAMSLSPQPAQYGANGMLDDWEENLAVITANRTNGDELVLIHLGDCLWKERSEITAAHICYLVADANFESYSDSARMCLIGADHWKYPRAYVSPEAIQRTELYEYSKVLGNSQFTLLPFQPYKLIYAYMLAEVGKVSDSLKYCQAVLKVLKTSRAPEVETWKQLTLSLEDRIRTHQQGGYASNLAPAKLVGKLLNFFDTKTHRVTGGLPPPIPSTLQASAQGDEHYGPRVSTSQSTMAMSSLMPSTSMEQVSEGTSDRNRMTIHNRSVSEPNFGRTPRQDEVSNEQGKSSASGGSSRFGRFGFGSQLLQKTVGLVLKPRGDRQAKLGQTNKFYYNEKLKRWVEEGAELPAEETALPPPPTAAIQNGMSNYSLKQVSNTEGYSSNGNADSQRSPSSESSSGMPPIPPGSSHFSARGRLGVRSRYVDTFNKGGGSPANTFQSPSVPSIKPAVSNFFVPAPALLETQAVDNIAENIQNFATINEDHSTSFMNDSFQSPPAPSSSTKTMQRFPSVDNFPNNTAMTNGFGSHPPQSRRTASWGGFNEAFSPPPKSAQVRPLGEVMGISPSSFMPNDNSLMRSPVNGGSFPDDLHEVEL